MMQRLVVIFFVTIMIIVLIIVYSGDYSKDLGNGYSLERTNACCVFVMKEEEKLTIASSNECLGRLIKPQVKRLYINGTIIVGLKVSNECCYLDECEKKHNTPNGYFIINKKSGEVMTGLKREDLKLYGININKMKEIL